MSESPAASKISIEYFREIESRSLPVAPLLGISLTSLGPGWAWATASYKATFLRPGGTVSGPVMMGLADYVAFAAVLSRIGPVELAVTSNLNINFLRKPRPSDLVARAGVLRVGRRLAYTDVQIFSPDETDSASHPVNDAIKTNDTIDKSNPGLLVAQSSVIYALPSSIQT